MNKALKFLVNIAAVIAAQAGVAVNCEGGFGLAKGEFWKGIARGMGYKFFCWVPSQHNEEDASGLPSLDLDAEVVKMIPMEFIKALTEPNWLLVVDELTTCTGRQQALLLTALENRRIGHLEFHPSTIVVGACNPAPIAPDGVDLAPPVLNRMYNHEWQVPFDQWYEGMMKGGDWSDVQADYPILDSEWEKRLPTWCATIGRLVKQHPELRETKELTGEKGMPTIRSWYKLARCLAAADSVSEELREHVQLELATGLVGSLAAGVLIKFLHGRKLYNAADVLDGKTDVTLDDDHLDQLIYLPITLVEELERDASGDRVNTAISILLDMADYGLGDIVRESVLEVGSMKGVKVSPKLKTRWAKISSLYATGGVK